MAQRPEDRATDRISRAVDSEAWPAPMDGSFSASEQGRRR